METWEFRELESLFHLGVMLCHDITCIPSLSLSLREDGAFNVFCMCVGSQTGGSEGWGLVYICRWIRRKALMTCVIGGSLVYLDERDSLLLSCWRMIQTVDMSDMTFCVRFGYTGRNAASWKQNGRLKSTA